MGVGGPFSAAFWVQHFRLLGLGAALIGSFLLYGVLQERIMTRPYDGVKFHNSAYLVLNNRVVAMLTAIIMIKLRGEQLINIAPLYNYAGVSVSNVVSTWGQYEALRYVSFPTQTLGKCGKMIPVMIIGAVMTGKRYGVKDYVLAALITVGCMVFSLTGSIGTGEGTAEDQRRDSLYGILLIMLYLFSDGFTSTLQEKMFKGYTMSTYNQMLYVNMVSAVFSLIALVLQNQLFESVAFSMAHFDFMVHSLMLSASAVVGQIVIYTTIKEFGALTFATIMTTRQFLNILLSCLIFLHPLTPGQWFGTVVVFGTLYYQAASKSSSHGHGGHGSKALSSGKTPASAEAGTAPTAPTPGEPKH